jgi:PAS domain S-box-containing protein
VLIALGLVVILGWTIDSRMLTQIGPHFISMKVSTAFCFVALGAAIVILALRPRPIGQVDPWIAVLAALVIFVCGQALVEYVTGLDFSIDTFPFSDPHSRHLPGRMSQVTAATFIGMTFSILFGRSRWYALRRVAEVIGIVGPLFPAMSVFVYFYHAQAITDLIPFETVAVHTAVGLIIGFVALEYLYFDPTRLVAKVVTDRLLTSVVIAVVLAIAIAIGSIIEYRDFLNSVAWRDRLYHRIDLVRRSYSDLQNAEAGRRSFLLTGQDSSLDLFDSASRSIDGDVMALRQAYSDMPENGAVLAAIEKLTQDERARAQQSIQLRKDKGTDAVRDLSDKETGRQQVDELRVIASRLVDADLVNLETEKGDTTHRLREIGFLWLITILGVVLLIGSFAVSAFRDLSRRRKAETDLRYSEARQRAILENVLDGVLTLDAQGTIQSCNPSAETVFDYAASNLVGKNIAFVIPELMPLAAATLSGDGATPAIGFGHEVNGLRRNGVSIPLEAAVAKVDIDDAELIVVTVHDLTERKKVDQMKSEFISTVSHELRTPLTSITGALNLLIGGAAGEINPKVKRLIEIAGRNGHRLINLVNDILDIEKLERGGVEFHMTVVDLTELIAQAVEGNRSYAEQYGVTFAFDPSLQRVGARVRADHARLMQVMANLLSNAAKFSYTGRQVVVELQFNNDRALVAIHNEGAGIPDAFRDRIFQKFAQAGGTDDRQRGGTGLGLSITKSIVERHGGKIGFSSEPKGRTTFFIELPALPLPERDEAPASPERARILVCEDNLDLVQLLRMMLEDEGYHVDAAASAAEAKALLKAGHYAAMTLDLGLPDQDGVSLRCIGQPPPRPMRRHASFTRKTIPISFASHPKSSAISPSSKRRRRYARRRKN